MKRFSRICTGIMLALFLFLADAGLLLGTVGNRGHLSYTAALLPAAAAAVLLYLFGDRADPLLERWGAKRTAVILTLSAFVSNLPAALFLHVPIMGDAEAFWATATALAAGEALENASYLALFPHLMGYSGFLSVFLRLFGIRAWVAPLLNVCLATLSGLFLFRICLRCGSLRQAAWASLLWTVCPSKVLYGTMVLSDGLYTCLLLAVFDLLTALDGRDGLPWKRVFPCGLLTGLLLRAVNISRPIAVIVIIALTLWLLFLRGGCRQFGRWLCFLLALLLVYVPLGKLWDVHVERLVGEAPAPVPGYNIYVGFNQESGGTYNWDDMELLGDYRWAEGGSAVRAQRQMLEAAKARVLHGSLDFPRLFADKLRTLLGSDEGAAHEIGKAFGPGPFRILAVLSNAFYYALLLLANAGALAVLRRRGQGIFLCIPLYGLGLILAQMLVEVSNRYHYSLIPILIFMTALSLPERKRR